MGAGSVPVLLASCAVGAAAPLPLRRGIGLNVQRVPAPEGHPGMPNVTLRWHQQVIDHFSWAPTPTGNTTYRQRYFVHDAWWRPGGPIFFYCGNEANVELYVNATGLMWENAQSFGAALVFAEHRYYGESLPFGDATSKHMHYLTMEQALADYAELVYVLKKEWKSEASAVIGFGGSYGGQLAAWMRMKYPAALDGAIAASAPILAFHGIQGPLGGFGNGEAYWQVVTRDATAEGGGAAAGCAANVRRSWGRIFAVGATPEGRGRLTRLFRLCGDEPLQTEADVMNLALMHLFAWNTMAVGNFPYPSNYLLYQNTHDPTILLPAFPVRVACDHINGTLAADDDLFEAMRDAAGVYYNVTGVKCFDLPADPNFDGIWDYQWCTEMQCQETYFTRDGVNDMFWPFQENMTAIREHCKAKYGVDVREDWIAQEFGGAAGATNIVFSNGLYDPWSSGGVTRNVSATAVAVLIPGGAHHLDLMFSDPRDPPEVRAARAEELAHMRRWVAEKAAARR